MFELLHTHASGARRGVLHTAHGKCATPFFMPIATKGAVKTLDSRDCWELQQRQDETTTPIVLTNTYHLALRPGLDALRRVNGAHHFMQWPGAMLTDSGGFQLFSLARLLQRDENGATFRSHIDGSEHRLTPEISMELQAAIGADIWMAFDYFPGYPATRDAAEESVALTTRWAERCHQWFQERNVRDRQLFGIVQGSTFPDLRQQSVQELCTLDFDGYAIGGLAVGEPEEEMLSVLETTTPMLPTEKPRYLMGAGLPEQILAAVRRGIDMFDCVIPTRNARHGSLFVQTDDHIVAVDLSRTTYSKLSISSASCSEDDNPISEFCRCMVCTKGYSRAYLRHLFFLGEPGAQRLATIHNLSFYMQLMQEIRNAIQS